MLNFHPKLNFPIFIYASPVGDCVHYSMRTFYLFNGKYLSIRQYETAFSCFFIRQLFIFLYMYRYSKIHASFNRFLIFLQLNVLQNEIENLGKEIIFFRCFLSINGFLISKIIFHNLNSNCLQLSFVEQLKFPET